MKLLLNPHDGASIKIERYMSVVGRIIKGDGPEIELVWSPTVILLPDQLMVKADIEVYIPWYIREFAWLPIINSKIAKIRADRKREAMGSCQLVSIRIGNVECDMGDIPLAALCEQTFCGHHKLHLPTAEPDQRIVFRLKGIALCDFTLIVFGYIWR